MPVLGPPGSPTCVAYSARAVAFLRDDGVGTRIHPSIAAQGLAYAFPCRRFDHILLADMTARLGASVFAKPSIITRGGTFIHLIRLPVSPGVPVSNEWPHSECPTSSFETRASHAPHMRGYKRFRMSLGGVFGITASIVRHPAIPACPCA